MLRVVSVLCVAIVTLQIANSKPTLSRQNDGFGYKYDVSHGPGNSNVHLNFGIRKDDQQKSKYLSESDYGHSAQSLPYKTSSPAHTEPAHYSSENNGKPLVKSEPLIYDPEINGDSHKSYASPYDSINKKGINEYNENYKPNNYQEPQIYDDSKYDGPSQLHYSDSNLPKEHVAFNGPKEPSYYSQQPVNSNYDKQPSYESSISQHDIDVPLHSNNPNLVVKPAGPSYPSAYDAAVPLHPTNSNHDNTELPYVPHSQQLQSPIPHFSSKNSAPDFALQQQIQDVPQVSYAAPASQHDIDISLQQNHPNIVQQSSYSDHVPQKNIDVPAESFEPKPTNYEAGIENFGDSEQVPPVGPKYVIIPSGPAYTQDSFSAEIIHGPTKPALETVPDHAISNTKISEVSNPSPVSHSIILPYTQVAPSPIEKNLPIEAVPFSSEEKHIDAITPLSHSTRLLIPTAVKPSKSYDVGATAEKVPSFVDGAVSDNKYFPVSVGLESSAAALSSEPEIAPISHSFRLNVPSLTPGVLPNIPDTKPEDDIKKASLNIPQYHSEAEVSPPPTHSFRLILPNVVPGIVPEIPFINTVDNYENYSEKEPILSPPISHSIRLAWPPTPSIEENASAPIVDYSQEGSFKSHDSPLPPLKANIKV